MLIDEIDCKDVYFPDDPTGELAIRAQLKSAFEWAGFRVTRAEKPSEHHPVWLIRCQLNRRFAPHRELRDHVWKILRDTGVRLRKTEVTVTCAGSQIQVNFVWTQKTRVQPT